MKSVFLSVLNIRVLLTSCVLLLMLQQSKGIAVVGNISTQQGLVEGAAVHTIIDGRRLDIHTVDNLGRYKIELKYNHKYELIFALEGNFSQKIVVETLVPDKVLKSNYQFNPLTLDVNLYLKIPGINISFVENPIRKIYYNPMLDDFISEVYKDETQIAKQIEQAVFRTHLIKKETEFLSKLTRFELAEMKREYEKILEKAGKGYDEIPVFTAFSGNGPTNNFFTNNKFSNTGNDEINKLLGAIIITAELDKEQTERFDDFIQKADNLLNQNKYTSARISYNRALSIYPDDDYAKRQCILINDLLEKQVEVEQYKYNLAYADNSYNELLYTEAAKNYRYALLIKPDEQYPKSRLEKINSILENELKDAERSTSYKQTMKEAEVMYQKQFYEKSMASYDNALNLEPGDLLASRKIMEIKHEMTTLADRLMYDKLIVSANKLYKKEQYQEAMKQYYVAAELNPDNKYAVIQINAINQKLKLDERFVDFISLADNQFETRQYSESRENYLEALKIDSKEKYPKERLKEIDKILIQVEKTNQIYQLATEKADRLFNQKLYEQAKAAYTEAGYIKPEETYPSEMNGKIDNLVTEQAGYAVNSEANRLTVVEMATATNISKKSTTEAEKDKNHNDAISKADNHFNKRNDEEAPFNNKLEVRDVENDSEFKYLYNQFVSHADKLFDAKKYVDSRKWYYKAWDMKPDENKPKQRIDNINQLLKELPTTQLDKEYLQFVDLADSTFRENQYAVARGWYNRALAVKSDEQYPKDQLTEIEVKIAERMTAQSGEQFETDVQKASAAFGAKNYNVARFWYKKALELRPNDAEVKSRLIEIEAAIK